MNTIFGILGSLMRDPARLFEEVIRNQGVASKVTLLLWGTVFLLSIYGLIMGVHGGYRQMLATAFKVPLLFLLTLLVCTPVLFMINVLQGSRLDLLQMVALILCGLAITAMLLMSFAPVAGFFGISSEYQFMKLLHVAIFGFAAFKGIGLLGDALAQASRDALLYPREAHGVFRLWILAYSFVGTQMAWFLRPFLGDPNLPFQLLRQKEPGMNFYMAVWKALRLVRSRDPQAQDRETRPTMRTTRGARTRAGATEPAAPR